MYYSDLNITPILFDRKSTKILKILLKFSINQKPPLNGQFCVNEVLPVKGKEKRLIIWKKS